MTDRRTRTSASPMLSTHTRGPFPKSISGPLYTEMHTTVPFPTGDCDAKSTPATSVSTACTRSGLAAEASISRRTTASAAATVSTTVTPAGRTAAALATRRVNAVSIAQCGGGRRRPHDARGQQKECLRGGSGAVCSGAKTETERKTGVMCAHNADCSHRERRNERTFRVR